MSKIEFTQETRQAIEDEAQACAQDMPYEYASDPLTVAQMATDARRLEMFGHSEAQAEFDSLCDEHGYKAVFSAIAEWVPHA